MQFREMSFAQFSNFLSCFGSILLHCFLFADHVSCHPLLWVSHFLWHFLAHFFWKSFTMSCRLRNRHSARGARCGVVWRHTVHDASSNASLPSLPHSIVCLSYSLTLILHLRPVFDALIMWLLTLPWLRNAH